jgi:hypothetical protein
MTQLNPYDPPRDATPDAHLARKARRLLEQRHEPITLLGFISGQWRRHVLFTVGYGILMAIAWQIGNVYLAIGLASFWAGRVVRDIQWYRTLVLEWRSTKELLDWEKIERLAA